MTQLEYLDVRGFKGINDIEVEADSINVITGRNNTGKTSLLQAIDLIFNPEHVVKYEQHIDSLINKKSESGIIGCEYIKGPQLSLEDFNGSREGPPTKSRNFAITRPNPDEAAEFFFNTVIDIAESGPESDYIINRFSSQRLEFERKQDEADIILDSLRNGITRYPIEEISSDIQENCLRIMVDEESYPYVYLGDFYDNFTRDVIELAIDQLRRSIEQSPEIYSDLREVEDQVFERVYRDMLVPRFGSGRFPLGKPPGVEGVKLSENIQLSGEDVDLSRENAAVRLSNIEDYIKRHNIIEDLDDLSLDTLVFRDDEEKYQVPYEFTGDGFKSFLGILWELSDQERRGNILLLEEPGQNMHPGYIDNLAYRMTRLSMEKDIQMFLSTHNLDVIRSFLSDELPVAVEDYLEDCFQIIQLENDAVFTHSYEEAVMQMEQLQLDLRSI